MHEMMDSRIWKQRRKEVMCEAELSRRAKVLRASRKRRDSQTSILVWEMKGHAERLLKLLGLLKTTG